MKLNKKRMQLLMARLLLNQTLLAKNAGITRQTLSAIMHGKDCKPETAGRIAQALGVDVTELLEREE